MPSRPVIALLASPFLGPAVWRPVADILDAGGWPVLVARAAAEPPRTPDDVLAHLLAELPLGQDLVLVPHSNVGLFAPLLTARRMVRAFVFVDALLPPGTGEADVAPAQLVDGLRTRADGAGLLPPWTRWWDEADVAPLFPDREVRTQVEREQRRLPLSYLEARVRVPDGWDARPGAYLAFGQTYARERLAAERRGWPVATMAGRHLHMLVDPEGVAREILTLLSLTGNVGTEGPT